MKHYAGCASRYPEKSVDEHSQQSGNTCVDCGAIDTDDWDDAEPRRKLTRQERLQGHADQGCDTWEEYWGER